MLSSQSPLALVSEKFASVYGSPPEFIARAPGRVNLIGEHTDYNDGFVLPCAINREVVIAASSSSGSQVEMYSVNMDRRSEFIPGQVTKDDTNKWSNYIRGVARMLEEKGIELGGARMGVYGNVPIGSGLSSSAALEVASAMAFQELNGFDLSPTDMALLCQAAENRFVGVNCGIMDQFISRLGTKGHALFIDCRSLEYENVPLPDGVRIVIADSLKKRGLVDSEYNTRRAQCEEAVSLLRKSLHGITALRDVSPAAFQMHADELPPMVRNRAEHVVIEDARVLQSKDALSRGDARHFGQLMNESHESLRDLYEVSCRELDALVESARRVPGVYGSRMTGAGFGGCTVTLAASDAVQDVVDAMTRDYHAQFGVTPAVYVCSAENGAEIMRT